MKFCHFLRRGLALLLLLATLMSLMPAVYAAEDDASGTLQIEVPEELSDEDFVVAQFDENGDIVYEPASEEIRKATRDVDSCRWQSGTNLSTRQRLAFFIDPSNSEGNNGYSNFTVNQTNIENLTGSGVTDFFVMTKTRAGSFSKTALKNTISYAGSAKVYAWMHCGDDDAYLKANEKAAQYHFRTKYGNIQNGKGDVTGYVHLGYEPYITYMQGLIDDIETDCSGVDGVVLDSVRFGGDYLGWDTDAMAAMTKDNWNAVIEALFVSAGYKYTTVSSGTYKGYYTYASSGGSSPSGDGYATFLNKNGAAAKAIGAYREGVINNFVEKMRASLASSLYLGVVLEKDMPSGWASNYYWRYSNGVNPNGFKTHIKNGFSITMQIRDQMGDYDLDHAAFAKEIAKYTNVFIAVDGRWKNHSSYTYADADSMRDASYQVHKARFDVNGNYTTYSGDILGAACYTAGNVGALRAVLSDITANPVMTVTFTNPNKATCAMLTYFNKHNDTNIGYDFDKAGISVGAKTRYGGTMQYYANTDQAPYGYIGNYSSYTNASVAALGKSGFKAPLRNFSLTYATLPFARFGFYTTDSLGFANMVAHYPIYYVSGHHACTDFTETVLITADCTKVGYKLRKCTTANCNYDYVVEVPTSGHNYVDVSVATAATCETAGVMNQKCSICSETRTVEIPALGHSWTHTTVAPTCTEQGYTSHVCARDASHNYVDAYVAPTGHNFVGGTCTTCGFSLATLIHFKAGAVENTWAWELIGGSGLGFDTSGNGAMYGSTDGMVQPYFYVAPTANGNIGHKIVAGDVIQIRMRVKSIQSAVTTATPSVSLEMASGTSYGTTLSGDSIDMTTTDWQIVTIPISGYNAGDTIERIRINPFGSAMAAAYVEIDYIHFGSPNAVPITITFRNHDGKVLQTSMIAPGTKVDYYGDTPTKRSAAGFQYTFSGWIATFADGTQSALITDLTMLSFSSDSTLTAQYTYVRGDVEPLDSDKYLADNDGTAEDYQFDIEIDASTYGKEVTINKEYKTPLDITILFDRSASIAFPVNYSNAMRFTGSYTAPASATSDGTRVGTSTEYTKLINYINSNFDKNKPEGYYVASNFIGVQYVGTDTDPYGQGCTSYESMRYNKSKSRWEVWQTAPVYNETEVYTDDKGATFVGTANLKSSSTYNTAWSNVPGDFTALIRPGSVVIGNDNFAYYQEYYQGNSENSKYGKLGKWVPIQEAYYDFFNRLTKATNSADVYSKVNGTSTTKKERWELMDEVYFRIGVSRRGLIQDAMVTFINNLYDSTAELAQGAYHTVKVSSYGYGVYTKSEFEYPPNDANVDPYVIEKDNLGITTEQITLNSQENLNKILTSINKPYAFGSTYTDYAFRYAQNATPGTGATGMPAGKLTTSAGRQPVAILVTDGAPTHGSAFDKDVADAALDYADKLKKDGYKIFSVGFMTGLNSATPKGSWNASASESTKANNFMHLISSNYTDATSMDDTIITEADKKNYYMSSVDGDNLSTIFDDIFTYTDTQTTADTQITGPLIIKDYVTREWDIREENGTRDIKVEKCAYEGFGDFADPVTLDASMYNLTVTNVTDANGKETGDTEIQVEWLDAPNAWLREAEEATNGYMGYKLLVTIGVGINRENTIGGNNIKTNLPTSGIFYPTNHDLDHYYEVPNVNVEIEYDHAVHDYFLDFYNPSAAFDLTDVWSNTGHTEFKKTVYKNMYSRTMDMDGLKNRYVDIQHYVGSNVYSELLNAGETAWETQLTEQAFNFEVDQSGIPVRYEVRPITSEIDSLGREPFGIKKPVQAATVNYYAPKYMVVDYSTTASVPMKKEIPSLLGTVLSDAAVFDSVGANAKYTFRKDADNAGEAMHILRGIEEIPYTVNAINTPKGASSNRVERKIHIVPANVVEYDNFLLTEHAYVAGSGFTGKWNILGSNDSGKQNYSNGEIHGFDSTLSASGADDNYSYGRAYQTTVSENIRDESGKIVEYHNNAALKFSFIGTGFDVISQTGPNEGIMIVEVYNEGTTTLVKRFMVDNYLADKTLYQIPVVHCMGLPYGNYDVVIRGYYSRALSHYKAAHTAAARSADVMTEAKIREILGLGEHEPLEYSLSADRAKATRALTANSYDITVDGIRIYNTLSDAITASSDPVGYYTYKIANEVNAGFKNVHEIMLDATSWTYGSQLTEGMLYVAAGGRTTDCTALDGGLHLSSDGIYNYKIVDGVKYLVNSNDEYIIHPEHRSKVYVEITEADGRISCKYYCNNTSGGKVELTGKQVGELIGKGKVVFYNSDYTVNSPKNEVYLSGSNGLAFNAKGANMLRISAKSIDDRAVALQVYDWTVDAFVSVPEFTSTTNSMEMYYNIHSYTDDKGVKHEFIADNGDVVIRNLSDATHTGVISICNIKVLGASVTPPANAARSIDLIITPPKVNSCEHAELTYGAPNEPTCVKEGNIAFWYCDDCECFFADAEATELIPGYLTVLEPTGEHDYVDGACSVCGDRMIDPSVPVEDKNLTASQAITVGAQMQVAYTILAKSVSGYERFYLEVTKDTADGESKSTIFSLENNSLAVMSDPVTGETLAYAAIYSGVNAKEMGDNFTVTLWAVDSDGRSYCGGSTATSIRDYLIEKADSQESPTELKTLAIDMLNYGAAAQLYFGYDTEKLVNAELTDEQLSYATTTPPAAQMRNSIDGYGINISTNVILGNEVTLNLTGLYASQSSDLHYLIRDAEGGVVADLDVLTVANMMHSASFADVSAKNMRKPFTIGLYDGDALISKLLTWSIEGYVAELLAEESTSATLRDLLNAMLVYGDSAAAYMGLSE